MVVVTIPVGPIRNIFDSVMSVRRIRMLVVRWVMLRGGFVLQGVERGWSWGGRGCGGGRRGRILERRGVGVRGGAVRSRGRACLRRATALARVPVPAAAHPRVAAAAVRRCSRTLRVVVWCWWWRNTYLIVCTRFWYQHYKDSSLNNLISGHLRNGTDVSIGLSFFKNEKLMTLTYTEGTLSGHVGQSSTPQSPYFCRKEQKTGFPWNIDKNCTEGPT